MLTIHSRRAALVAADDSSAATHCPLCGQSCKLNEIVRSAYHVLGCKRCYGNRDGSGYRKGAR